MSKCFTSISSVARSGEFLSAKTTKIDSNRAQHRDAADQFSGRLSNRGENAFNLAMEIVWLQREVLALDERVLLVEEEALIERIEDQHHEAGCARKALAH